MPKWSEVRRFLERKSNGWVKWKAVGHHTYYRKSLANGELLVTCISHAAGEIPLPTWHRIKKQMRITDDEFNRGK